MLSSSPRKLRELLPWYISGTLAAGEQKAVRRWLHRSPEAVAELAEWQQLRTAIRSQAQQTPSPTVWQHLMTRMRSQDVTRRRTRTQSRLVWAWGGALALAITILLWGIIQPGIVLQWSVNDGPLTTFRVYRAPVGSADFELVCETSAQPDTLWYTYVDARLVPGQTYVYRVEGLGSENQPAISQAVTASALEALPGQMAILLIGLISGYGAVMLARQLRLAGGGHWGPSRLVV